MYVSCVQYDNFYLNTRMIERFIVHKAHSLHGLLKRSHRVTKAAFHKGAFGTLDIFFSA
jgi:hypothetical protein